MFAPYWDKVDPALRKRFEGDHAKLRAMMAHPEYVNESWNKDFAVTLRDHARFEERELFPAIEPFCLCLRMCNRAGNRWPSEKFQTASVAVL